MNGKGGEKEEENEKKGFESVDGKDRESLEKGRKGMNGWER